jgi:hypothetical protein
MEKRALELNPAEDVRLKNTGFDRVLHVYPEEWKGLRAAAAYAPGHKLSVSVLRKLSLDAGDVASRACSQLDTRVAIFHGWSASLEVIARRLNQEGVRCLGVWHGSAAQFHYEPEYEAFVSVLAAQRQGVLAKVAAVKPGMHMVSNEIDELPLLNFHPNIAPRTVRAALSGAAVVAVDPNWRKNFHVNVLAAMRESRIADIHVTAAWSWDGLAQLSPPPTARIHNHGTLARLPLFELMAGADVVMNAALSECQPMVMLEALALRVPCLVPRLELAGLKDHPYAALTEVASVDTLPSVHQALGRVMDLAEHAHQELLGMLDDFSGAWRRLAAERFAEFVGTDS